MVIDTIAPETTITYTPQRFTPDGDGVNDTCYIHIDQEEANGIVQWFFVIYDYNLSPFKTYSGEGTPPDELVWDGRGDDERLAESFAIYNLVMVSEDLAGNIEETEAVPLQIGALLVEVPGGFRIRISNVEFEVNKAAIRPSFEEMLDVVADILKEKPIYYIRIEGHCDITGPADRNLELSFERADAVKDYLISEGINPERINTQGYSNFRPLTTNQTIEGRQKNRRVEFLLLQDPLPEGQPSPYQPPAELIEEMQELGIYQHSQPTSWEDIQNLQSLDTQDDAEGLDDQSTQQDEEQAEPFTEDSNLQTDTSESTNQQDAQDIEEAIQQGEQQQNIEYEEISGEEIQGNQENEENTPEEELQLPNIPLNIPY